MREIKETVKNDMRSIGVHRRAQYIRQKTPPKVVHKISIPKTNLRSNFQSDASSEWSFNSEEVEKKEMQ